MIPTYLLLHTCTATRATHDRDRRDNTKQVFTLSHVRIAPTRGIIKNDIGITAADSLTLFYDVKNSTSEPAGYVPQAQDVIEWNGNKYTIHSVTAQYTKDVNIVHHYEGVLV